MILPMKSHSKMPAASESQSQVALFQWAAWHQGKWPQLAYMFAIPNGGNRDRITGMLMKREGVKRGVPDIFLPWPSGPYHGLFIEMKTKKGKTTEEQETFLNWLAFNQYQAVVCRSTEQAIQVIERYLLLKERSVLGLQKAPNSA